MRTTFNTEIVTVREVLVNTFRASVTDVSKGVFTRLHDLTSVSFQSQERILSPSLYVSTLVDLMPVFKVLWINTNKIFKVL